MSKVVEVRRDFISEDLKQRVFKRDLFSCRYCGTRNPPFHLDHVYPVSKGGETSANNLVTSCIKCNRAKLARVGMWPKPIGYFSKKYGLMNRVAFVHSFGMIIGSSGLVLMVVWQNPLFIIMSVFGAGIVLATRMAVKEQ